MKETFYDWYGLNLWLFRLINGFDEPVLTKMMVLGTLLGGYEAIGVFAGLIAGRGLLSVSRNAKAGKPVHDAIRHGFVLLAVLALSLAVQALLVSLLKVAFDFPRPPGVLTANEVRIVGEMKFDYSLPSGHAARATGSDTAARDRDLGARGCRHLCAVGKRVTHPSRRAFPRRCRCLRRA